MFYFDTHNVNDFLKNINFKHNFILITHNSDGKVIVGGDQFPNADSNLIPDNLKFWFAQNVCVSNEKIFSIPIGLENSEWFPSTKKIEKIKNKSNEKKSYKNLLYINHNVSTNLNERNEPYELFKNDSWVTIEHGSNGNNFDNYLNNISSHKFVLCPEGNGTDTHRTWETLYVGSIPIEKRNINNSSLNDLPICFVDKWSDITEDFLNKEYDRITNTKWDLSKLNFNYWVKKIENYVRDID